MMVFQPYVDNLRNVKGYAKKNQVPIYVPRAAERIVKIMEDEFACVFIERNTLRGMLLEEAADLIGHTREYLLFIDACLEENNMIDWYAGFVKGRNREIYYELMKDEVAKQILNRFNELHFGKIIQSVKELLLEKAIVNSEIIVYDKEQKNYMTHLQVHGFRVIKTKLKYDNVVKFCLANKHVILTFNMETDC
jgi:hypothetical protein